MAENRHRTVLEIKTDQTQAEIDIKRLQDMVDQLQKAAANIGFGGGAGGGVPGASGGAAPRPPRTDSGAGGAAGGGTVPPPATGGGPGGSPSGTSGDLSPGAPGVPGAPGAPGAGPGLGGGGFGGGGPAGPMGGGAPGGGLASALGSMGLGRLAGIGGAAYGLNAVVGAFGRSAITPQGYFSPGAQVGFDLASRVPIFGQLAGMFKQAGEKYGSRAEQAGRQLERGGLLEMAGFNTGLSDPFATLGMAGRPSRDFLGRSLGAPVDTTARDFIEMGYGIDERLRLGQELLSASGRSLSGLNVGGSARMTRAGADMTSIGTLIRAQREFGATGVLGGTAVDVLGRRGLGGIESLVATNQSFGYTGAAMGDLFKRQVSAFAGAQEAGLQRDFGEFTQTQADIMGLGISGFRGAQMAQRGAQQMASSIAQSTGPIGDIASALIEAQAYEGATSYADVVRNQERMSLADQVQAIRMGAGTRDEGALMLKDRFGLSMEEADRLMDFEPGMGDVEDVVDVQGGLAAARARALGEQDLFGAIDKEDITRLTEALLRNEEATLRMGRTIHRMLGN